MIILLMLGVCAVGIIIHAIEKNVLSEWCAPLRYIGWFLSIIGGIVSLIMIIIWLCMPLTIEKRLAEYEAMKITLEDAREHDQTFSFERAKIISSVITNG